MSSRATKWFRSAAPALIVALAASTVATGCVDPDERADFARIDDSGWAYGDTIRLDGVASPDSTAAPREVRLDVAVRHTNAYPYRNLWLEVTHTDRSGRTLTDTVGLELCDLYGRWYGKGIGDLFQYAATVSDAATLLPGSVVSVRHIMRVDTLAGLERVGVSTTPKK